MTKPSTLIADFKADLRHAVRLMRSRPTPALLAMGAIMLGIGVSSAVFSIFNAVLLRELPYREPGRLVMLWNTNEQAGMTVKQQKAGGRSLSMAEYRDWKDFSGFEHMIVFGSFLTRLGKTDDPEIVFGYQPSAGFFQMLGVSPMLGRGFSPEEDREGGPHAVLLQYDFWMRRFHGDRSVLGKSMYLSNEPFTIIGVMAPDFVFFSRQIDFLTNFTYRFREDTEKQRGQRFLRAMARLRPGVSLTEAQQRADAFSATLAQQHPGTNRNWRLMLVPLAEDTAGELRPALLALLAAIGCVLLITCANITNLLLVQASARSKEFAVRVAMGAGRVRLLRQLLTESLLLSLPGGALGLGLAYAIVQYFRSVRPDRYSHGKYLPQAEALRLDPTVIAFAVGVTIICAVVFGLVPGFRATRPDLSSSLKDIGRGSVGGRSGRLLRNSLVIAEVTVAVVLVVGAALLVRSFVALYGRGPGFRPDHLLTMEVSMAWEQVEDEIKAKNLKGEEADQAFQQADRSFRQRLYHELGTVPGIDTFTTAQTIPLSSYYNLSNVTIEGRAPDPPGHEPRGIFNNVHANYFELLGIPLLQGRLFGPEERPTTSRDSPRSIIISQEFVRRYFPNQDPLGKRIRFFGPWATVVGVVGDIREDGMDRPPQPYFYFCDEQMWFPSYLIVHSKADPMAFFPSIRQAIRRADSRAAIYRVLRLSDIVSSSAWRLRYSMLLLGSLAAIALALAMVGVYGVLSYSVRERTQEIGVRMALGANRPQVLSLILRQGLKSVGAGVLIGLLVSATLTRFLQTLLFGVTPLDGGTFAVVALALLAAGALASYLPALRAATLDPMAALRHE